jgi:hypothetical protein
VGGGYGLEAFQCYTNYAGHQAGHELGGFMLLFSWDPPAWPTFGVLGNDVQIAADLRGRIGGDCSLNQLQRGLPLGVELLSQHPHAGCFQLYLLGQGTDVRDCSGFHGRRNGRLRERLRRNRSGSALQRFANCQRGPRVIHRAVQSNGKHG